MMQDRIGQQLGNYRLLRLLGRGGFAEVYLGKHVYLETPAALKVLHTVLKDEDADVFVKEARTLAQLAHPHIVRVLDFAVQDGTPFLVMEYAPKGTLRQRHPPGTRLPLATIESYVRQVASALQYAHDRRFIHRDIKPENMLLGPNDEIVLSDFGLVMLVPHTLSMATQAMGQPVSGTPPYLAPEQLHGLPRPASDQYALGIVVYEWLCGRQPFQGSFLEVIAQHLSATPPSLCQQVPDLLPGIEEVVFKALAKEPKERFATVEDFAIALQRASQATSPMLAPLSPPSPGPANEHPSSTAVTPAPTFAYSTVAEEVSSTSRGPERPEPIWKVPATFTSLIGREQDVADICAMMKQSDVRLLTLLGIGGIGKTRLSMQVATQMRGYFTGGICFVGLAPINDPNLVLPSIAQELAIQEIGDQPSLEQVEAFLQDKHFLLILDNFEQVVAAASLIEELLAACPALKIIVTSRIVLHLQAEQEYPVSSLSLPNLTKESESGVYSQSAAVALFVQRARAVLPAFQITQANARTIAEICVRLDGLPLALELAAARVKLLPPQALLTRLSQRLQVLTGGARGLPERQQTLRNTLKWSYDLLDAGEQRLFRRLSVFVGGWTLQAVEAVWNAGQETASAAPSLLDAVASLLDKSLLLQIEQEGEEPRLIMLETVREYGLDCLRESGELEVTQRAHAQYFLALAEEAEPELAGPGQSLWLERLEQEHDNLRAAMRWMLEGEEDSLRREMALRLGGALRRFWMVRGYFNEGQRFLERALAHSEGVAIAVRAKALKGATSMALDTGENDRAEALCKECLSLFREMGDRAGIAFSLYLLGYISKMKGDLSLARALSEEALACSRQADDKERIAWTLYQLGTIAVDHGEYARAQALFEESLATQRALGNKRGIAISLIGLAQVLLFLQGDQARLAALLVESLALFQEVGDRGGIADSLILSSQLALGEGDAARARSLVEESVALYKELEDQQSSADALCVAGRVAFSQGDYAAARAFYEESLDLARGVDEKVNVASGLEGLANVVAAQGELMWAVQLWGAAESLRESIGAPLPPVERPIYERSVAAARTQLEERTFAVRWAEGRALSPEQVLASQGKAL